MFLFKDDDSMVCKDVLSIENQNRDDNITTHSIMIATANQMPLVMLPNKAMMIHFKSCVNTIATIKHGFILNISLTGNV